MHKKNLIELYNIMTKDGELTSIIHSLYKFLQEYENCFTKKESIEALKNIKQYLKEKENEIKNLEIEYKKTRMELNKNCKHEVLIDSNNRLTCSSNKNFTCSICHKSFNLKDIDFHCIILEKDVRISSYFPDDDIGEIIYQIFSKDEDIMEVFENYVDCEKIRIYRR